MTVRNTHDELIGEVNLEGRETFVYAEINARQ